MALLKIIKAGDPVLKATAKPVAKVNKHIKKILDDMAETMYAADGVGLAAPRSMNRCSSSSSMTATA